MEFPPMALPVWHPLLRTGGLLHFNIEYARDLMFLADALADEEPRRASPREVLDLVALDLWQLWAEVEVFDEWPEEPSLQKVYPETRKTLASVARQIAGEPRAVDDSMDPVRALAALRMAEPGRSVLKRLGTDLAYCRTEHTPRVLKEPAHGSAIGAYCDLDYLATVLRQQEERTDGTLKAEIATWAHTLEREVRRLHPVIPSIPDEEDLEITRPEIPVPGGIP